MSSLALNNTAAESVEGRAFDNAGLVRWLVQGLVFSIVFLHAADFRGSVGGEFEVHWQIYLRLLSCAVCGAMSILLLHRSLTVFATFPGLLFAAQLGVIGVACLFSIDKTYSAAAFVSLVSVCLFVPAAISVLGAFDFVITVSVGLLTYLVGSWVTYLVYPDIGVFQEQVSKTEVFPRMGGLGHPNELGFFAATTVVMFAAMHYLGRVRWLFAGSAIFLGTITLVTCFSRTSILLTGIGLVVVYRSELMTRRVVLTSLVVMLLVIPVVGYVHGSGTLDWMLADLGDKVSKSGSSDELTTATGRTDIWIHAIHMIGEEPLKGYGYGTQRFVMVDHSYHCHNTFLNYCMSAGLLAGVLYGLMVIALLNAIWKSPRPEVDGVLVMMLVGGMAEGMLLAPTPHCNMLMFLAGLLWRQMGMNLGGGTAGNVDLPTACDAV